MIIKIIYEEITSYVDGEDSYVEKCELLKNEIEENPDFAFQFRVQKCVKNLLQKRFCDCNAPEDLSKAVILKKIKSKSTKSNKK